MKHGIWKLDGCGDDVTFVIPRHTTLMMMADIPHTSPQKNVFVVDGDELNNWLYGRFAGKYALPQE